MKLLEQCGIRFIKNELDKVRELFNEYQNGRKEDIGHDHIRTILGCGGPSTSWYSQCVQEHSCTHWHIDGISPNSSDDMVMVTYDSPTQVILDPLKILRTLKIGPADCDSQHTSDKIEKVIKDENLTIFEPNLGDVYYFPQFTVHRINPKAVGKPRLCVRIHNPILGKAT